MRAEIRRIHRELGRTTIYVTHDQDEALSLADRIVVMKDGVVQQVAAPEEVYAQPANLHVARFMGYRNVLDAQRRRAQRRRRRPRRPGLRLKARDAAARPVARPIVAIRPEDLVASARGGTRSRRKVENRRIRRTRLADRRARSATASLLHVRTRCAVTDAATRSSSRSRRTACWSIRRESDRRMSALAAAARIASATRGDCCWSLPGRRCSCCCFFIYPFGYGFLLSFTAAEGRLARELHASSSPTTPLAHDLHHVPARAAGRRSSTSALALPIAFQLRRKSRYQRWVTTMLVVPITLGTVLIAEGMLTYFGPSGWLSQFLQLLHIYDGPIRLTHNFWGVLISLVISGFPVRVPADPLLRHRHRSGARARGRDARRRPVAQFRHIYLPLLAPGLAMSFCLAFVQAFSVFPSAVLLGSPAGPTRVISLAAYEAAFEQYDYSMASAIAMIMGFVQLIVVVAVLGAARAVLSRPGRRRQGMSDEPRRDALVLPRLERPAARPDGAVRRQHRADGRGGRHQLVRAALARHLAARRLHDATGTPRRGRNSSSATCCGSPSRSCSRSCCCRS